MKTHNGLKGLLLGGLAAMIGTAGGFSHELEATLVEVAKPGEPAKATEAAKPAKPAGDQAKVQIAILLDTSGSMSGLIEQTKTQLWQIVNTFIDAKQNGKVPFVEVALYEYGNDGLSKETHWVRRIQPLTRDLDKVSEELFTLRTNGGSEYCGAVIQRATLDLQWDSSPNVYKAIFVAGNEAFTQGPVEAAQSCKDAVAKGVIVNTIHCGGEQAGINGGWKSGAVLADGKFLVIDHNRAVVHVDAPQDVEIVRLNTELNKTYIPVGKSGQARVVAQSLQDANAEANKSSGASVQRAVSKASSNYYNANWDLVDASKAEGFKWSDLKEEDLPEEMKALNQDERKGYVANKQKERDAIQAKIQGLNKLREAYVADKRKEMGDGPENTLDQVVAGTVREQAAKQGYSFEKK